MNNRYIATWFLPLKNNQLPITAMNNLYFGDCLDVLFELTKNHPEPFIDIIYIDPPFNSKRNYNVLFESIDLKDTTAQRQAFTDTWSNVMYIVELNNLGDLNKDLFDILTAIDKAKILSNGGIAYLTTMAYRIWYMHKLLKNTGSFFLHCDPTMSHYLKMICDIIFGDKNFKNEIIWQRTSTHNDAKQGAKHFGRIHDVILFYCKSSKDQYFNTIYIDYSNEYVQKAYNKVDEDGRRFKASDITGPGGSAKGNPIYDWKGVRKYWRYSHENMLKLEKHDRIYYSSSGMPYLKHYLDEMKGISVDDLWIDIKPPSETERLGYPTQKPETLLERIINACSKEGYLVADFFCGCGTAVSVAQKLKRKWIGVDISHLAIRLIQQRLMKTYGVDINRQISLHGFPRDVESAKMLARDTPNGRINFQEWVIEVLLHGITNVKKSGDGGYDGFITYKTDFKKEFVLVETKSGTVGIKNIREFIHVVNKQKAAAGIFVCFQEFVTKDMVKEAKSAGHILVEDSETGIDKIQLLSIDALLNGSQPHLPNINSTFKDAEAKKEKAKQRVLFE